MTVETSDPGQQIERQADQLEQDSAASKTTSTTRRPS